MIQKLDKKGFALSTNTLIILIAAFIVLVVVTGGFGVFSGELFAATSDSINQVTLNVLPVNDPPFLLLPIEDISFNFHFYDIFQINFIIPKLKK